MSSCEGLDDAGKACEAHPRISDLFAGSGPRGAEADKRTFQFGNRVGVTPRSTCALAASSSVRSGCGILSSVDALEPMILC